MTEADAVLPISHTLDVGSLPGEGTMVKIRADADALAALAEFYELPSVTAFSTEILVKPWRSTGVSVVGTVSADIVQACIVTLDPVENAIREPIDLRFLPADALKAYAASLEVEVDPLAEDPPELLEGPAIDVGAIACEHFALGIDPYPRKPGVAFEPPATEGKEGESAKASPFAALQKLRQTD